MSSDIKITGIRAVRRGPEGDKAAAHAFIVSLDGPSGPIELEAPPEVLMYYDAFVRWGLVTFGGLYMSTGSDGRPGPVADENWRHCVRVCLEQSAAQEAAAQAPPPGIDTSTLN